MKEIYAYRNKVWISHVSENIYLGVPNKVHGKYFPEIYWSQPNPHNQAREDELKQYFCVYIDYLPHDGCHNHIWQVHKDVCKNPITQGIITRSKLEKLGNELVIASEFNEVRDHPFVRIKKLMLQSEWIFVYKDKSDLYCINKGNKIIHHGVLQKFLKVCRLFSAKMEAHKVSEVSVITY